MFVLGVLRLPSKLPHRQHQREDTARPKQLLLTTIPRKSVTNSEGITLISALLSPSSFGVPILSRVAQIGCEALCTCPEECVRELSINQRLVWVSIAKEKRESISP